MGDIRTPRDEYFKSLARRNIGKIPILHTNKTINGKDHRDYFGNYSYYNYLIPDTDAYLNRDQERSIVSQVHSIEPYSISNSIITCRKETSLTDEIVVPGVNLIYLLKGKVVLDLKENGKTALQKDNIYLAAMPKSSYHFTFKTGDFHILCITFHATHLTELMQSNEKFSIVGGEFRNDESVIYAFDAGVEIPRLMDVIHRQPRERYARKKIDFLGRTDKFLVMATKLITRTGMPESAQLDVIVSELITAIDGHLIIEEGEIENELQRHEYSPLEINQYFIKRTGVTILDYFKVAKIKQAHLMILQSDYSIEEISQIVGYTSEDFEKDYIRYFSLSPYQSRETRPQSGRYKKK